MGHGIGCAGADETPGSEFLVGDLGGVLVEVRSRVEGPAAIVELRQSRSFCQLDPLALHGTTQLFVVVFALPTLPPAVLSAVLALVLATAAPVLVLLSSAARS